MVQEVFLVLIFVRADERIISMKNSDDTIQNRNHDLPACSAVSQPTAPQGVLINIWFEEEFFDQTNFFTILLSQIIGQE